MMERLAENWNPFKCPRVGMKNDPAISRRKLPPNLRYLNYSYRQLLETCRDYLLPFTP